MNVNKGKPMLGASSDMDEKSNKKTPEPMVNDLQ